LIRVLIVRRKNAGESCLHFKRPLRRQVLLCRLFGDGRSASNHNTIYH